MRLYRKPVVTADRAVLELLMQATLAPDERQESQAAILFRYIGEHPVDCTLMGLFFVYLSISS
jgi:hypothetical protein